MNGLSFYGLNSKPIVKMSWRCCQRFGLNEAPFDKHLVKTHRALKTKQIEPNQRVGHFSTEKNKVCSLKNTKVTFIQRWKLIFLLIN